MKTFFKWLFGSLFALIVIVSIGFFVWTQFTYGPTDEGTTYAEQGTVRDDRLEFGKRDSTVGFILYPGAKVEKEAYAFYGVRLAEEGVFTVIPGLRLNLGILDIDAAEAVIDDYPEIERWYVGGHSLGGSAASSFAESHLDEVEGLILLASYPINSLRDSGLRVLSIYGDQDGLLTLPEDIEKSKGDLPEDTRFVEISGGNHANFGMYGKQKGDNDSSLTDQEQLTQVTDEIVQFLEN